MITSNKKKTVHHYNTSDRSAYLKYLNKVHNILHLACMPLLPELTVPSTTNIDNTYRVKKKRHLSMKAPSVGCSHMTRLLKSAYKNKTLPLSSQPYLQQYCVCSEKLTESRVIRQECCQTNSRVIHALYSHLVCSTGLLSQSVRGNMTLRRFCKAWTSQHPFIVATLNVSFETVTPINNTVLFNIVLQ